MKLRLNKISGSNALMSFNVGEITWWAWGPTILGVQTNDGTYRSTITFVDYTTREQTILKRKQKDVGLMASWIGYKSRNEIEEIVARAMMREYVKFARGRMTGEIT